MSDRHRVMLLFGPPGVGKGTQGRVLGTIPGIHHLATGDMFRALDKGSPLGRRVRAFSARGELVPDELTIELWQDYVKTKVDRGDYLPESDLLLLDGIPRSAVQVHAMKSLIDVLIIVHLKAPGTEDLVQRMKRRALYEGRRDDADEDVIRRRFEVYEKETAPVLAAYPSSLVGEVDPIGTPVEVLHRILGVLVPVCRDHFGNPLEG